MEQESIYRGAQEVATLSGGVPQYVLRDVHGSARLQTSVSGARGVSYEYQPYGEEIEGGVVNPPVGEPSETRQQYAGMERDDSTGIDHTWWRTYDSSSGRWTSPDPYTASMSVSDPQSFNRYSYVENDPVNRVDPSFAI